MKSNKKHSGVTLLETMVVLGIIGIMTSIALPRLTPTHMKPKVVMAAIPYLGSNQWLTIFNPSATIPAKVTVTYHMTGNEVALTRGAHNRSLNAGWHWGNVAGGAANSLVSCSSSGCASNGEITIPPLESRTFGTRYRITDSHPKHSLLISKGHDPDHSYTSWLAGMSETSSSGMGVKIKKTEGSVIANMAVHFDIDGGSGPLVDSVYTYAFNGGLVF